jgi:hypothetical protein
MQRLRAILFSATSGVAAAGIDDIIKENGRVALHCAPNSTHLNSTELVGGDNENGIASTKLKEMQMFCEEVFAEYTKE